MAINREKIYSKTNGRCFYCGQKVSFKDFQTDHFIPKSKGGNGIDNLVPSCADCNYAKSNSDIENFRENIQLYLTSFTGRMIEKYFDVYCKDVKFYFEKEGIKPNGE